MATKDDGAQLRLAIRLRLVLPCVLLLFLSSLDRVNLSFAALHMNRDLGLSPTQYAFAAGVVFVGYLGGQYPSILLLQRIGMRRWIACCTIIWGTCAVCSAFVTVPWQLYGLRFILGLAEGGLAPGLVVYLSQFATERDRAGSFALPMLAIPLSVIVGGPLSGWLMQSAPSLGWLGWRWMLLVEALPTILLGLAGLFYFPDTPEAARWLSSTDKAEVRERALLVLSRRDRNDWSVLTQAVTWLSALAWFALLSGAYGLIFWLPQLLKQLTGGSELEIGQLNALPWVGNAIGIWWGARCSDRSGDRYRYLATPAVAAGAMLAIAALFGAGGVALAALVACGFALGMAQGAFWALPASLLPRRGLAVGTVTINVAGSFSGLVTPLAVGAVRGWSAGPLLPGLLLAGMLLLAGGVVAGMRMAAGRARTAQI